LLLDSQGVPARKNDASLPRKLSGASAAELQSKVNFEAAGVLNVIEQLFTLVNRAAFAFS
jgi:hypothetical protein